MAQALLALAAAGLGMVLVLQVGSNSILGRSLGNLYMSVVTNMGVGVVAATIVMVVATRTWPSAARIHSAPWWSWWLGGLLGTLYINGYLALAPRMGAAALVGCIVTGQLAFAVIADHYGWVGFRPHAVSLVRAAGCALMIAGAWCITRS